MPEYTRTVRRVAGMRSGIDGYIESIRGRHLSVILADGEDQRALAAARRLKDEDIADPILIGDPVHMEAAAGLAGISLGGLRFEAPRESSLTPDYAEAYAEQRQLELPVALRLVRRPLFYGGMMMRTCKADALIAGLVDATASIIQAGSLTVGLATGISAPSSYFLIVVPDGRTYLFADCAVNVEPDPETLADIALATASSARTLLGQEPRVALLSFSTRGSAAHPLIDRVRSALEIARDRAPDLNIDGELQLDAAIDPDVAARKVRDGSDVAGRANVLIFPDLQSGNIGYKLVRHMAGAQAYGPVLQGFAQPVSDLSRGATVEDIIATSVLVLSQAAGRQAS